MSTQQKLVQAFATALAVPESAITDDLAYEGISEWDSVAHMALVTELEGTFDVMLDTDEILALSSVAKAREILAKHGVAF
jgi:acyl carrier protein